MALDLTPIDDEPAAPHLDLTPIEDESPKLPDTSGIQKMAQDNLSKQNSSEGTGPVSPSQNLDNAMGYKAFGRDQSVPLPTTIREHAGEAIKNGTANSVSDYMQSAIPAVASSIDPVAKAQADSLQKINDLPGGGSLVAQALWLGIKKDIQDAAQGVQMIKGQNPSPAQEDQSPAQKLINQPYEFALPTSQTVPKILAKTAYGISENFPELAGGAALGAGTGAIGAKLGGPKTAAFTGALGVGAGAAAVNYAKTLAPTFAEELKANPSDPAAAYEMAVKKTEISATATGASFSLFGLSPFRGAVKNLLFQALGVQPAIGAAQKASENVVEKKPVTQGVGEAALQTAASTMVPLAGDKLYHAAIGREALKPIVGKATNVADTDVTPDHIDQTIHKEYSKEPTAQNFNDAAVSMFGKDAPKAASDTLNNIWQKTGVTPDKVFEDAQTNPEIVKDVESGNVPKAYDGYLEKPQPEEGSAPSEEKSETASTNPPEQPSATAEENTHSQEGASASINPLGHIFNPVDQSESSINMATAIRQGRGPAARETAVTNENLRKYSPDINKLDDQEKLDLIHYIETRSKGGELNNPKLQAIADTIRDIYAKMADKVQEVKPDVGLIEDYFTHSYKDPSAAKKFFGDFVAKQGSERSLKKRTIPTLKEAIAAGLEPKTTNPLETVMSYVGSMNNLIAAHKTLEIAQEGGIADYFRRGQQPEGWVPLNGNLAEKGNKILYAPEDAARVYNNDVSGRATGPLGSIADVIQKGTNFVDKLLLGLSGYHAVLTTISSAASDVTRALTHGTPIERAKDLASAAGVIPVRNVMLGTDIEKAYLGHDSLSPTMQQALDLAIKNNAISVKQQDYWKAGPAKDYIDSFRNGTLLSDFKQSGQEIKERPLVGTAKVLGNELGKVMDTLSKPLFDIYIPRMKNAALIQEAHDWLESHPTATDQEKDRAIQDIGNSIDNRFGEMMRDNLFWHQYTRQALQLSLLSYSWVTGGIRMLGGGKDAVLAALGKKELSSNAKYLFGMAATYAVMNGAYTYMKTGKPPDNWMDLVYPRTGGMYPSGKPERVVLPSHIGQYTQFLLHGYKELGNEANPALKLGIELANNKDFRGMPITNENNPWYEEQMWDDYLQHTLHQIEPIGIKTFLQGKKVNSNISMGEALLGIRQAPMEVADPERYKQIMEKVNNLAYEKKLKADVRMKKQYENGEDNQP